MPGNYTNGLPIAGPPAVGGLPLTAPAGTQPQLPSKGLIPVDTETAGGQSPQSIAASAFQIAAIASALQVNTQTSTAGAATSNTFSGRVITEALTTAAGAVYTFTLTNNLITTTSDFEFDIRSGTNRVAGLIPASMTLASGSAVLTFLNTGTAALNGTMVLSYHV